MQERHPPSTDPAETVKGALLMMAAMAGFVFNDGFMRLILEDLPLFQTLFLRGLLLTAMLVLVGLVRGSFRSTPSKRDQRIIGLRSLTEVFATLGFMTALMLIPFANLSAILQVLPLTVTLAAAAFLGAPIGWRRMLAIVVGFVGVLIIIRPDSSGFNIGSLVALGVVGFVTVRDLASRQLSPAVPSIQVATITAIAITAMGGIGALFIDWAPVTWTHAAYFLGTSSCLVVGYIAAVATMRHGDIAAVTPFRYTALVWAILIGIFVFDEKPDALTMLGSAIIVGMGIFSFYRERRLAKPGRSI